MLRKMRIKDLKEVEEVERSTQASPWSPDVFMRCLHLGHRAWVIGDDDQSYGFVILSFEAGEGHLLNFAVHPDHQGKGYGTKMLEHVLAEAKKEGAVIVYLEVRRSNKKAIGLYEKLEFNQIAERKNYYPGPNGREDALVYARDLSI